MRLSSLLHENHVRIDVPGPTLSEGANALLQLLEDQLDKEQIQAIRKALEERRCETSDMIGNGVAVPHARVEGLDRFFVCIGNSVEGLEPCPCDSRPAGSTERIHLIFLIVTPQTQITLMLQTLASIARLCHKQETRKALQSCKTPSRIVRLVEESDVEIKRAVTASDAMRTCRHIIAPDADLSEVLKMLVKSEESALPVVNADKEVLGVITPMEMFRLGLPRYVDILGDVEFLTSFEPFEQVLANEKTMRASEIASDKIVTVSPDAPILQVAHMMVTAPTSTVFVVDANNRLRGVVHESDILAKVLMP